MKTQKLTRFAIMASGRGSNFDAICESMQKNQLNADLLALVSNKNCLAVEKAQAKNISTFVSKNENDLIEYLKSLNVDHIVLAGYMKILSDHFIHSFPLKNSLDLFKNTNDSSSFISNIINIHPSLLPAFPGVNSYEQAFTYGVKFAGITIHFVVPEVDSGPICAQKVFDISKCKNSEEVEALGLTIEHQMYSQTLKWIFNRDFFISKRGSRLYVQSN